MATGCEALRAVSRVTGEQVCLCPSVPWESAAGSTGLASEEGPLVRVTFCAHVCSCWRLTQVAWPCFSSWTPTGVSCPTPVPCPLKLRFLPQMSVALGSTAWLLYGRPLEFWQSWPRGSSGVTMDCQNGFRCGSCP